VEGDCALLLGSSGTGVATIKMMADAATETVVVETAASPIVEKPAATLTRDQMKMVAQAIKRINLRRDR